MIQRPTVFVLGAGASKSFELPSGPELADLVVREGVPGESLFNYLVQVGFQRSDVKAFQYSLARSARPSVDAFLEHRPEFMDIGKVAIAATLLPREREAALLLPRPDNWYRYLFQALNGPFELLGNNHVAFITFNYDRSLEKFLFTAFTHAYGEAQDAVRQQLGELSVVHVHGQLGPLPELGPRGVDYGAAVSPSAIQEVAAGIRVVHEGSPAGPEFARAQDLLREAEVVCFLGFGYHAANMQRLGIPEVLSSARWVYGSGVGLTAREIGDLNDKHFGGRLHIDNGARDCVEFLRQHVSLE